MDKIRGNVFQTSDYDKFVRLEGNRPVLAQRITKIEKSIRDNGYILNPIVVNEKMQVIDGQGRLEALKRLSLPVDYVVADGAGLTECVALNSSSTKWGIEDFINSYCELGNENYIRFRTLINEFPELGAQIKYALISGSADGNKSAIKNGNVIVDEKTEKEAREDLKFALNFKDIFGQISGKPYFWYYSVVFARKCRAKESRLIERMKNSKLYPANTIQETMNQVSDIYNKYLNDDRIYLYMLYQETMTEKYGWYKNKWGK